MHVLLWYIALIIDPIATTQEEFKNVFPPHKNEKMVVSNSSCSKSTFEKLCCFRDELVPTDGMPIPMISRNKAALIL